MKPAWVLAFLTAIATCHATAAAGPYKPPRNGLGQPDLEGLWSTNSLSRLERPDIYPSVVISEAQARDIRPLPLIPADDTGQAETETYDEGLALSRVGNQLRSAFIVDPPDGRLPFTPEGRARASTPPAFDGPEPRTNQERCIMMPGIGPPLTNTLYNNNLQILQTRDDVVIFLEANHEARIVPLLPKKPAVPRHAPVSRWMGDSVGWWEGDALVMETTHFDRGESRRSSPLARLTISPQAVITERLQRISQYQILYSYTVVDSANYTRPWRGEMPLNVSKGPIYEYACHEGNYSLPNILAGARAQERAAAAARAATGR